MAKKYWLIYPDSEEAFQVDEADFDNQISYGARPAKPYEIDTAKDKKYYEDKTLDATVLGVARGLTLGGSDYLLSKYGGLPREHIYKIKEASPIASFGGELGGTAVGMLIPGTASFMVGKAGVGLGRATGAVAAKTVGKKTAEKMAQKGVKEAFRTRATRALTDDIIQGGIYGGAMTADDVYLREGRLPTEKEMTTGVGLGAGMGVGVGAALRGVGAGYRAYAKRKKPFSDDLAEQIRINNAVDDTDEAIAGFNNKIREIDDEMAEVRRAADDLDQKAGAAERGVAEDATTAAGYRQRADDARVEGPEPITPDTILLSPPKKPSDVGPDVDLGELAETMIPTVNRLVKESEKLAKKLEKGQITQAEFDATSKVLLKDYVETYSKAAGKPETSEPYVSRGHWREYASDMSQHEPPPGFRSAYDKIEPINYKREDLMSEGIDEINNINQRVATGEITRKEASAEAKVEFKRLSKLYKEQKREARRLLKEAKKAEDDLGFTDDNVRELREAAQQLNATSMLTKVKAESLSERIKKKEFGTQTRAPRAKEPEWTQQQTDDLLREQAEQQARDRARARGETVDEPRRPRTADERATTDDTIGGMYEFTSSEFQRDANELRRALRVLFKRKQNFEAQKLVVAKQKHAKDYYKNFLDQQVVENMERVSDGLMARAIATVVGGASGIPGGELLGMFFGKKIWEKAKDFVSPQWKSKFSKVAGERLKKIGKYITEDETEKFARRHGIEGLPKAYDIDRLAQSYAVGGPTWAFADYTTQRGAKLLRSHFGIEMAEEIIEQAKNMDILIKRAGIEGAMTINKEYKKGMEDAIFEMSEEELADLKKLDGEKVATNKVVKTAEKSKSPIKSLSFEDKATKEMEDKMIRTSDYIKSVNPFGNGKKPSKEEVRKYRATLAVIVNPERFIDSMRKGVIKKYEAEALKTVYPKQYELLIKQLTRMINEHIANGDKYSRRQMMLFQRLGIKIDKPKQSSYDVKKTIQLQKIHNQAPPGPQGQPPQFNVEPTPAQQLGG